MRIFLNSHSTLYTRIILKLRRGTRRPCSLLSFQTFSSTTTLCSTPCILLALATSFYISLFVEILLSFSFTHYLTRSYYIQSFPFRQPIRYPQLHHQQHHQHPLHHLMWFVLSPSTMMKTPPKLQHHPTVHLPNPTTVIPQPSKRVPVFCI